MKRKPNFTYNQYGVKDSSQQYRNIEGIFYKCVASDPQTFEQVKKEAKKKGLECRIIKGELYKEIN